MAFRNAFLGIGLVVAFSLSFLTMALPVWSASNENPVPNPEAFLGWKSSPQDQSSDLDPYSLPSKRLNCHDKRLFPTDPFMTKKNYLNVRSGRYDVKKLTSRDESCAIGQKAGKMLCLRPKTLVNEIISDTYQDACGNFYRGYKEVQFFSHEDHMGTLLSPGRTVYEDPRTAGQFSSAVEVIHGQTYPVDQDEFVHLTELLPGDAAQIERDIKIAKEQGFRFDPVQKIFIAP